MYKGNLPKASLNFNFPTKLIFHLILLDLRFEEDFEGHYIFALFLSSQVNTAKFASTEWAPDLETIDGPPVVVPTAFFSTLIYSQIVILIFFWSIYLRHGAEDDNWLLDESWRLTTDVFWFQSVAFPEFLFWQPCFSFWAFFASTVCLDDPWRYRFFTSDEIPAPPWHSPSWTRGLCHSPSLRSIIWISIYFPVASAFVMLFIFRRHLLFLETESTVLSDSWVLRQILINLTRFYQERALGLVYSVKGSSFTQ